MASGEAWVDRDEGEGHGGVKPLGQPEAAAGRGGTEDGNQVQHALLTDGTAFDVDASDAEQEVAAGR